MSAAPPAESPRLLPTGGLSATACTSAAGTGGGTTIAPAAASRPAG